MRPAPHLKLEITGTPVTAQNYRERDIAVCKLTNGSKRPVPAGTNDVEKQFTDWFRTKFKEKWGSEKAREILPAELADLMKVWGDETHVDFKP